jgi:hypothetical protein
VLVLVLVPTIAPALAPRQAGAAPGELRFGIYPWGATGSIGPVAKAHPDQPLLAIAATRALKGQRSLTVHLYGDYTGARRHDANALLADARLWSRAGMRVEMVLRYRPKSRRASAGYVTWVGQVARRLAALRGVTAIQIGNEANNTASRAAADGAYPGAVAAIAQAIPVARQAVVRAHRPDIGIGFNFAASGRPCATMPFWPALRRAGGAAFRAAVGWVGINVYPGTWSPPFTANPSASAIEGSVISSLRCLRTRHIPAAGLGRTVTIRVTETGYPTDPARSDATQAAVLVETVDAVERVRRALGVTDLRWFALRDGNTASGQLQNGYGLLHDDYSPKLAFVAYREIIADEGS